MTNNDQAPTLAIVTALSVASAVVLLAVVIVFTI
jgi:hypothetical protein